MTSAAGDILHEAAAIVGGVRQVTHGDKERSFVAIGQMWTTYINCRKNPHGPIRPADVCQMMVLLKQQRAEWGTVDADHFVDACGYSALAGELAIASIRRPSETPCQASKTT